MLTRFEALAKELVQEIVAPEDQASDLHTDLVLRRHLHAEHSPRNGTLACISVRALRLSFTGELGWELHFAADRSVEVYQALATAGERLQMVDFGVLATESMRLEKPRE